MSGFFGGGKNQSKSEETAETPDRQSQSQKFLETLKARFDRAKYSNHCRTIAFRAADDEQDTRQEWLKAVEEPQSGRWMVFKVTAANKYVTADNPKGLAAHSNELRESDLSFYDMIVHLATYEKTQPDTFQYVATEPDRATLGPYHFRAVAEQEGIVFDHAGLPHPTLAGMIVTQGDFPPEAEAKALKIVNEPPQIRAPGKSATKISFNQSAHLSAIDRLLEGYDTVSRFDDFIEALESLQAITEYYRTGFDGSSKDFSDFKRLFKMTDDEIVKAKKGFESSADEKNFSSFCFNMMLEKADKALKDALGKSSYQQARILLDKQHLYFEIFRANALMKLIYNVHPQSRELSGQYKEALDIVEKIAAKLGEGPEQINYYKGLTTLADTLELPEDMQDIVGQCRQMKQQKQQDIEKQKQRMALPPAAPTQKATSQDTDQKSAKPKKPGTGGITIHI